LNLFRVPRIAWLGLLCGVILSGCGGSDGPSLESLSEAKEFDVFRVYYAGEEVAGLPLEGVEEGKGRPTGWNFYYGDCDPPSFAEGGCELPLQIQNYSACSRWAGLLHSKQRPFDFRGAKATGNGDGIENPVEIFTGRTTVVIFATRGSVARSTARQLRNISQAQPQSLLPPPVPGSLQGQLPCQGKPG
jgi:hypothetical protein